MNPKPDINIIIPLYNEIDIFSELIDRLNKLINTSKYVVEVILVDDGSTDGTRERIKDLCLKNHHFHSLLFSRNFGQNIAVTAGIKHANATEAIMIMDGDLQDPPEMLDQFYNKYKEGYDVVYAIRKDRKENIFLKMAYISFSRIMKKFSYIDIPLDSGDFSLISKRVADDINQMPEEGKFFRGMRAWVGYNQIGIPFSRDSRHDGQSKYSLKRLISLAMSGIFNFSKYPIRFTMILGIISMIIAIVYFIITIYKKVFIGDVPMGFTALLFAIILFGGIQLIAIGVIGEYILRIFFQVKNRPQYIISDSIFYGEQKKL